MKEDRWAGLDAFLEVAATGSFTAAAQVRGVSVSHVSREIARLEARLDTVLLARSTRRVTLTEAGRALAERGRRLVDAREAAFDAVTDSADAIEGQLRLTCPVAYGEAIIVPIVNRFMRLHPRLSIEMILSNSVLDLSTTAIDLAIRIGDADDPRLHAVRLSARALRVCAAPAYLARAGVPATIYALQHHDCLIGSADKWHFTAGDRDMQIRPRSRWRCNSGFAVLDAALHGLGLCQLPDYYVADALATGALVEILTAERPRDQGIWAIHPDRGHPPRRLLALIDYIRREMAGG